MVLVVTSYLRIRQKSKGPDEIDPPDEGNSPKSGDDRHGQVFCRRQRGFERVWAGCRAPDRVGPKSGLPLFTIAHFLDIFSNF